jgi:hypothetical protein
MQRKKLSSAIPTLLVALLLALPAVQGCGDDDDDGTPAGTGRIEGFVEGDAGHGGPSQTPERVEGASVTLARFQSNGSLETIEGVEAVTDADGRFSLETDVFENELVVRDTTDTSGAENWEWMSVVSGAASDGGTLRVQPLNDETTVEAEVLAEVRGIDSCLV